MGVPPRGAPHATCMLVIIVLAAAAQLISLLPNAFSRNECEEIVNLFQSFKAEKDVRSNPLLPLMEGSPFRVARVNRFDDGTDPHSIRKLHEAVLVRVRSALRDHVLVDQLETVDAFSSAVAFTLLHEFVAEQHDHFDWHIDTKPGDGTGRTMNINVMLSAGDAYEGGELQVGNTTLKPQQGSIYVYPAALPHRVTRLQRGRRYTLILALATRDMSAAAGGVEGGVASDRNADYWHDYWRVREAAFGELLAETTGSLADEPKVHILHGEVLEAAGREDEAQQAFCRSYRALSDGGLRLSGKFYESGVEALQAEGRDLKRAERFLAMAACIDKNHGEAVAAVEVVREALAIVRRRDEGGLEGVPTFKNFIENDPTHVAMSLGEKEDL